jgi:branched-chain amino acid transport system permease protein
MTIGYLLQLLANGLVIGAFYALLAMGLSLIFGVLEIVNFAHGEFYMLGAVGGWLLINRLHLDYWTTIASVTVMGACVGWVFHRVLLRGFAGRNFERSLLLTLGLGMALQNGALYIFTATPQLVRTEFGVSSVLLGDLRLSVVRLLALVWAAVGFIGLYVLLYRTRIGQAMRAVAENREAALIVGIRPERVARLAVVVGIALCGLSGAALAPVYVVTPTMGLIFAFKSFAIVVIGGFGSIGGAAVAAIALGVIEALVGGTMSLVLADAVAFVAMILVLLFRPLGLFGTGVRV